LLSLYTANKILIIRLSSLGDILLTTPLIRSIKNKFPDLQVDFLLKDRYGDVLRYNPNIRNLFSIKPQEDAPIDEISSNDYDLIIDLQNNFRSK
jgi:ADP-heptose:LPS heptosyltransferase